MLKYSVKEICEHIDILFRNLQISRSVLPYITNTMVGQSEIQTPGYYKEAGYCARILYEKPLTIERINNLNEASDSINQGFIIRLCAYLEYCHVYEPCIDKKINGNLELDFIRRLRNVFAHTSGVYNKKNNKQKKLRKDIIKHFNIPKTELSKIKTKFPISIKEVLEPLVKGCKKYIQSVQINERYILICSKKILSKEEAFFNNKKISFCPITVTSKMQKIKEKDEENNIEWIRAEYPDLINSEYIIIENNDQNEMPYIFLKTLEQLRKYFFKNTKNDYKFYCISKKHVQEHNKKKLYKNLTIEPINDLKEFCEISE